MFMQLWQSRTSQWATTEVAFYWSHRRSSRTVPVWAAANCSRQICAHYDRSDSDYCRHLKQYPIKLQGSPWCHTNTFHFTYIYNQQKLYWLPTVHNKYNETMDKLQNTKRSQAHFTRRAHLLKCGRLVWVIERLAIWHPNDWINDWLNDRTHILKNDSGNQEKTLTAVRRNWLAYSQSLWNRKKERRKKNVTYTSMFQII